MAEKIKYKILICDDNVLYLERFRKAMSEVNLLCNNAYFQLTETKSRSECLRCVRDNAYDLILLDVCIKADNGRELTNLEIIRHRYPGENYPTELYEQILEITPSATIFVISNLSVQTLHSIFNGEKLKYFCKKTFSEQQIATCVKNYFDTGKKRIYNNAFVVYGHNQKMKESVQNYIKSRGIKSIDLFGDSNGGIQWVFEALSDSANMAECAIVLLSADDIMLNKKDLQFMYRARQNVIFEMGLFAGYLGKDRVIVLYEEHGKFEFPSDIGGIFYIKYDETSQWKNLLHDNLEKMGFNI